MTTTDTLYADALRNVPAVALAHAEGRRGDAVRMHSLYLKDAAEHGVDPAAAFATYMNASTAWSVRLWEAIAELRGTSVEAEMRDAMEAAARWVPDGG